MAAGVLVAAVAALLLLLGFVAEAPEAQAQQQGPRANPAGGSALGTNGAKEPRIVWGACPEGVVPPSIEGLGYECATARVPLSYRNPDGPKIELALGRLPATDPDRKIGTLFWNPGGPGGSGRIPPPFSEAIRERFDIVGFDPRGTNGSTPIRCFSSNEQALDTFGRPFPITPRQEKAFFAANERGTRLCARNAGPLLSHVSTANVARDMELLRRAVGDEKLTYIGFSYGTFLGEVYANLFPGKVRALALDAVLDPVEWTTGERPGQAFTQPFTYRLGSFDGAEQALNTFLAACANDERCAFREEGASAGDLKGKYEELLARLKEEPAELGTPDGQTFAFTYQDVVGFTLSALYSAEASPFLAGILEELYRATEQRQGAEGRRERPPEVDVLPDVPVRPTFERPDRNRGLREEVPYFGLEWFNAVSCTDTSNPNNPYLWSAYARLADQRAPGFGPLWTYASTPCATWPARDPDRYTGPWNKRTANPLLLIGNRLGDPATPYDDARTTANRRLADARLLTLDSFGHTAAYGGQSRCIDRAVDRYLIGGELPPKGKVCQPDRGPFDPVPSSRGGAREGAPPVPQPPRF
jgi:pimeloyl-ACP methyl ester carboxylesterase